MRKAVVISFFRSNNLGDLALSYAIENLVVENGYEVLKYDFLNVTPVTENNIETSFEQKTRTTNSKVRSRLGVIKRAITNIVGVNCIENTYYLYNVLFSKKWKKIISDIKSSDILVLAGGNMVMDISPTLSIPNWATIFRSYCRLASKYKKPLSIAYIGAGPFNFQVNKEIFGKGLDLANNISVRDSFSKKVCEELVTGKEIVQTVDPVFSLPISMEKQRISLIGNLSTVKIGICVLGEECFDSKLTYDSYIEGLYKLIMSLSRNVSFNNKINFILFSTETADYSSVEEVYTKIVSDQSIIIKVKKINKVDELIGLYQELNFLIGGRMHSLIFAQKCLLPFIGVIWQRKIEGFGEVTNSSNRIYEVCNFNNNINSIGQQIFKDIKDINLINKMNKENDRLKSLARKGLII